MGRLFVVVFRTGIVRLASLLRAPEVLNQNEHGKPINLWSVRYCLYLQIFQVVMER
jgi:hypothetical protein